MQKIRAHEIQHVHLVEASKQAKDELQELVPELRENISDNVTSNLFENETKCILQ